MAKKSVIARNEKRKRLVSQYREKRAELKASGEYELLQKLPRNASPVRIRNRSYMDGRPRGYMGQFGISRVEFRKLANEGKIPGVKKASW